MESVFGGEIFTDRDGNKGYSVESALGGELYYGPDGQRGYSVDSALGGSLLYGDHPVLGDRNSFGGSDSFTDDAPGADDW